MPKRSNRRQQSNCRRQFKAEVDEDEKFEDRLDLRREIWIALIGIPAFTALAALVAWHRAFVEPAWASPVSALLILLTWGGVAAAVWHFVLREGSRLWMALATLFHIPLAVAPAMLMDGTWEVALEQRGVTETCTVVEAELSVSHSRGGSETNVRHGLSCSGVRVELVTSLEDRHEFGDSVQATYDPEGMARPSFDGPVESSTGRMIAVASAATVATVGIRMLYVWWRVSRSRRRKRERASRRRGRARAAGLAVRSLGIGVGPVG